MLRRSTFLHLPPGPNARAYGLWRRGRDKGRPGVRRRSQMAPRGRGSPFPQLGSRAGQRPEPGH